jgi:hypothetical protein
MAMKKCTSHPDVVYARSEVWSKDKYGPAWCWISSDAEVPCSVHHKSKNMQNMQNMQMEQNIMHILRILPGASVYSSRGMNIKCLDLRCLHMQTGLDPFYQAAHRRPKA